MQRCIISGISFTLFAAVAALTAFASDAESTNITLDDVAGQWHGSKDDIRIRFSWDGKRQHANLRQSYSNPSTGVGASLVPLQNQKQDTIDLRLDLSKKKSAIIATIKRDSSGTLRLSVVPKVKDLNTSFRVVEDVVLHTDDK